MEPQNNQHVYEKEEQTTQNVSSSNAENIHYEDGKIQKKVYGGGDSDDLK